MIETHYKETDHRATPLRILCTTATNAIDEIIRFSKVGMYDGSIAMEYVSCLQGAVLVACQAYAAGSASDINKIRKAHNLQPLRKHILYNSMETMALEYSCVALINSLANYFKHNEEWSSWPNNPTTKILSYYDINELTEYPMNSGISRIIGESEDLRGLCEILEMWREAELQKCKVEFTA